MDHGRMESAEIQHALEDAVHSGVLDLSSRGLEVVPSTVWTCAQLVSLTLSCNALQELSAGIAHLKLLQHIDVGFNKLQSLPPELCSLVHLVTLSAPYNQLTTLPKQIGRLQSLASLELHDNALTELPASLGDIPSLTHINLQYNRLGSLPHTLANLGCLGSLQLDGNPLPSRVLQAAADMCSTSDAATADAPTAARTELHAALAQHWGGAGSSARGTSSGATGEPAAGRQPRGHPPTSGLNILVLDDHDDSALDSLGRHGPSSMTPRKPPSFDGSLGGAGSQAHSDDSDDGDETSGRQPTSSQLMAATGDSSASFPPAVDMEELMSLPPAAAAVLYRTLDAVQTGTREVAQGRPLSRGGTSHVGVPAAQLRSSLASASGRPGTSSLTRPATSSLLRPGTSARSGSGSYRPGSSSSYTSQLPPRPSTSSMHTAGGGTGAALSSVLQSGASAAALPSWMQRPSTPNGVHALLAGAQGVDRSGAARPGTASVQRTGGGPSGQEHFQGHPRQPGGANGLEGLPAITFPLTAGVRSMLKRMERQASLERPDAAGAAPSGSPDTAAAGRSEDAGEVSDVVRALLAARSPGLLQSLEEALAGEEQGSGGELSGDEGAGD